MKKLNTIAVFVLLTMLATGLSQSALAQITIGSKKFEFPNGAEEWSAPLATSLTSESIEKKGLDAVPLEFRIKVTKKASSKLAPCKYEVEVKNLSDKQGISFEARNDYTDVLDKYIYHKVKVKPGQTETFDIAYWRLGLGAKTKEDCTNAGWSFVFVKVKAN